MQRMHLRFGFSMPRGVQLARRLLALNLIGLLLGLQSELMGQSSGGSSVSPSSNSSGKNQLQGGWVVRDPTTGRLFHQQLVEVTVPTVRWENRSVTTTVVQPQWVTRVVPQTEISYQASTQMVLQPYWQGRWNPFRQPTLAYRHVPLTTWQPTPVTTNRVVATQQLVPTQQTVQVPQPVSGTQTVQQLVQTEIPQATQLPAFFPGAAQYAGGNSLRSTAGGVGMVASQPPLLGRFPLLAGRPAWQSPGRQYVPWQGYSVQPGRPQNAIPTSTRIASTVPPSTSIGGSGLRPVERAVQNILPPAYQAPLQTASRPSGSWDVMQSGLRPTILR